MCLIICRQLCTAWGKESQSHDKQQIHKKTPSRAYMVNSLKQILLISNAATLKCCWNAYVDGSDTSNLKCSHVNMLLKCLCFCEWIKYSQYHVQPCWSSAEMLTNGTNTPILKCSHVDILLKCLWMGQILLIPCAAMLKFCWNAYESDKYS